MSLQFRAVRQLGPALTFRDLTTGVEILDEAIQSKLKVVTSERDWPQIQARQDEAPFLVHSVYPHSTTMRSFERHLQFYYEAATTWLVNPRESSIMSIDAHGYSLLSEDPLNRAQYINIYGIQKFSHLTSLASLDLPFLVRASEVNKKWLELASFKLQHFTDLLDQPKPPEECNSITDTALAWARNRLIQIQKKAGAQPAAQGDPFSLATFSLPLP